MTTHKRKKAQRLKGSRTHGWGLVHRGSGNRGGFGRAGGGKKADCKKPSFDNSEFGKHGFKSKKVIPRDTTINVSDVEEKLNDWVENKKVEQKEGSYVINLTELGYDKLLGSGRVNKKLKIIVTKAAPNAVEKVKAAGGLIELKK